MNKLFLLFIIISISSGIGHAQSGSTSPGHSVHLFVDGICGMCKERIEKAAGETRGVRSAAWDVDTRQLTVVVDPEKFNEDQLHRVLANVGHDTEKRKAPAAAYNQLDDCCRYRELNAAGGEAHDDDHHDDKAPAEAPGRVSIFVNGVCGMCEERIEKAANTTAGVKSADWDMETHQLTVEVDPGKFNVDRLHRIMANIGHDTEKAKAPDDVYNSLDDCCKYRDPAVVEAHGGVFVSAATSLAQVTAEVATGPVQGIVFQEDAKGRREPLVGVNIYWLGTSTGTTTDAEGRFGLARDAGTQQLVVSYVGFRADTIDMTGESEIEVLMSNAVTLKEVEVKYRRKGTEFSFLEPIKVQKISEGELLKAACCNLSESFETNPAVDVSFTDAVTGTRQIEMLGLAGPYVQITRENMPDIRGLSALYGLTYIPGPWIEGMELVQGPGSVINGFESMAGQINIELRKPEAGDRMYLNLYANEGSRYEGNLNLRHAFSDKVQTALLLHGRTLRERMDRNGDGFVDNPVGDQLIAVNRWHFGGQGTLQGQFGIRGTYIDDRSGQLRALENGADASAWGAGIGTRRLEGWAKIGRVFPEKPYASIGLQLAALYHDQDSRFGRRAYDADQRMGYANLIYQSIFGNSFHKYRLGASFQWDSYRENLNGLLFDRNESAPGAFFEYTYDPGEKFTAVAGIRADYHNLYGAFVTPRLHLRYAPSDRTVLRASVGRGQRTASIIAENIGVLASSRELMIMGGDSRLPYGLDAEVSWNYGVNLTETFRIAAREATLSVDAYHTRFQNQIVVDYDEDPQMVHFYNLDGKSYSTSLQTQLDFEPLAGLDVRLAYRFNDVQTTFLKGQLEKPFISRHRAFLNAAYATGNGWKFDYTLTWQGSRRIPSTAANPAPYRLPGRSPDFFLSNAQISKSWKEDRFELYVGGENLFNFTQSNPILSADDPFSPYFDSSLIWGPVFGRMVYTGLRWRI